MELGFGGEQCVMHKERSLLSWIALWVYGMWENCHSCVQLKFDCYQSDDGHSVVVVFVGLFVTCGESQSVCSRHTSHCLCDICVNQSLTVSTSLLTACHVKDCLANMFSPVLELLHWFARRSLILYSVVLILIFYSLIINLCVVGHCWWTVDGIYVDVICD